MAKSTKKKQETTEKSVLARTEDGTVQITIIIPWNKIEEERKHVAQEMGQNIEIPGFRKGKAPIERVMKHIPQDQIIEHTLSHLLPDLVSDAIKEHKISPAIYPRFELVKAQEGEDWQIRAITAEIPEIKLGDYKKSISGELAAMSITKEPTKDEKEQKALHTLLENVEAKIPTIIIDEEVNARLAQLLQRLEKLGLTLESYLASTGKTPEQLRQEYRLQAEQALKLDFILSAIGETENVEVTDKEVDEFINVSQASADAAQALQAPEQRAGIRSMLRKRKVIDSITTL
jgi:FKBP-type peptidyl-prolyl cis-trans isomerase (trigger factor)